jgi:hypothetical protein
MWRKLAKNQWPVYMGVSFLRRGKGQLEFNKTLIVFQVTLYLVQQGIKTCHSILLAKVHWQNIYMGKIQFARQISL